MVMNQCSEDCAISITNIKIIEVALNKLIESESDEWDWELFPEIKDNTTIVGEMLTRIVYWVYYKYLNRGQLTKYCKMGLDVIMVLLDSVHLTNGECLFNYDNGYWIDILEKNENPKVLSKVINNEKRYKYSVISIITKLIKDTLTGQSDTEDNSDVSYSRNETFEGFIKLLKEEKKVYTDAIGIYLEDRYIKEVEEVPEVVEDSVEQEDNQSCVTEQEVEQKCNLSCVTEQEVEQKCNLSCVTEQEYNQHCVVEQEIPVVEQEVKPKVIGNKIKVPISISYSEDDAISDISTSVTRENGKIKISITYVYN